MATNTAKRPASPNFGYRSDIQIPPQLKTDPEGIFKKYRERGLIDPKYKNFVDWQNAVLKRSNELGYEVSATLNKMNAEWLLSDRGRNSFTKLGFTDKDIKAYNKAQAKNKLSVGPFRFKGPPIERVRYKSAEQAIADGLKPQPWWSKKKGLPFRTLQASPRAYGERIPLEMEDWFKNLEAKGTIPKGTFKKYAGWVYEINDANKARATNFSKRVGIPKFFNKGHLAAILNNTFFGGSNDPASQILELTAENISHGATDAISLEDMRKLDLPTNWGESAAYYMVNELGIEDNRILTGTGLPMRWSGKDMLRDSDIARITRFGENPDVILAETQNRLEQLAQEIEANRAAGLGDAESLKQIQSRMVDGRYVAPTIAEQTSKAVSASKKQSILDVIPKKLARKLINQGTATGLSLFSLDMSLKGRAMGREDLKENSTFVNSVQSALNELEVIAEGGTAGLLAAAPFTGGASLALTPFTELASEAAGWTDVGIEAVEQGWKHRSQIWEAVTDKENQQQFIESATNVDTYKAIGSGALNVAKAAPGFIKETVSGYAQEKVGQVKDAYSKISENININENLFSTNLNEDPLGISSLKSNLTAPGMVKVESDDDEKDEYLPMLQVPRA